MTVSDRFRNTNFELVFGELQTVYRLKRGLFEKIFVPAVIFSLFLFGIAAYLGSEDWLAIPFCALPFLLMFLMIHWHLFATRRTELKLYENGFTYSDGRNVQTCLWTDIEFCHPSDFSGANGEENPLQAVQKKSGELIEFEPDQRGTSGIYARVNKT